MSNQLLMAAVKGTLGGGGGTTPTDANFSNVAALLHGDGTNNAANNTFVASSSPYVTKNGTMTEGSFSPYGSNWSTFFSSSGTNYLSLAASTAFGFGTGAFTIECWFLQTATNTSTYGGIIDVRTTPSAHQGTAIAINTSNQLYFYDGPNNATVTDTTALALGQWYHIALTRDASGVWRLFKNGAQVATTTAVDDLGSTQTVRIGQTIDNTSTWVAGNISNVRVVKGTALYTAAFTPPTGPLTAVSGTSLLTCQNSYFVDNSTNAATLTVSGSPQTMRPGPFADNLTGGNDWSAYFAGGGTNLTVASSTAFGFGTGAFTIECWINNTAFNSNIGDICDLRTGGTSTALTFRVDGTGHLSYFDGPANNVVSDATAMTIGVWYHVALTRDASGVWRLFKNGTQVGTSSNQDDLGSNQPCMIGQAVLGTQYGIMGYMSNFRVVKGTALYTSAFTPPTGPLTAVSGTSLLTLQNGSVVDNSSNAFSFTTTGSVPVLRFNPFSTVAGSAPVASTGNSAWFDGSTGYLTSSAGSNVAFSGDFTVEAWIYLNVPQSGLTTFIIDSRSASATNGWYFGIGLNATSGTLSWGYGSTAVLTDVSSTDLPKYTWNHVAYSRQGATNRMFINGKLVASATDSTVYTVGTTTTIGARYASPFNYFNGYMTDVRIVNGTALYTAAFTPNTAPLTATTNTVFLYNGSTARTSGIYDSAVQQNVVTQGIAQISTAQSKFGGGSLSFNGTSTNFLQMPVSEAVPFGPNWTVEAWIYPAAANISGGILSTRANTSTDYAPVLFTLNGGSLQVWCSTGGSWAFQLSGSTAPSANAWHHVAAVSNNRTVTLYLDGVSIGSASYSGNLMTQVAPTVIGVTGTSGGALWTFNGYIDEVRVTNGIARYTANFTPSSTAFGNSMATDPYFNYVSMLIHGDGSNGAANTGLSATFSSSAITSTALTKTGTPTAEGTFTPYGTNWSTSLASSPVSYLTYGASTSAGMANQTFAIECWVNFTTLPTTTGSNGEFVIWQKGRTGTSNFELAWGVQYTGSAYQILCQVSSNGTTIATANSSNISLTAGTWNHFAITQVGGSGVTNFWFNGTSGGSMSHGVTNMFVGTGSAAIGNNNTGTNPAWQGYISNLRVVFGSQVYTSAFTPSKAPLTAITGTNLLTCQSNSFVDTSTNAWAITPSGSMAVTRFNPFGDNATPYNATAYGGSLYLDGSTGYLTAPNSTSYQFTDDFTIEYWVYQKSIAATTSHMSYWTSGTATACAFRIEVTTSGFIAFSYGIGGTNTGFTGTTAKVIPGAWNHVAITRKGTVARIFVNGVQDTTTSSISGTLNNTSSNPLYIGVSNASGSINEYTAGYMTDVRIVNGTALYTANFTPSTTPATNVPNTVLLYQAQSASATGVIDNAMQNDVATVGNTKVSTTQVKYGSSAMYFDGSNSGLWLADAPHLNFYSNNFTVECWFNASASVASGGLFGKRNASTEYTQCEMQYSATNILSFYATTASGSWPLQLNTPTLTLGTWYHIAVVRNGNTFTMYLNGTSVATGTLSGSLLYNSGPFIVGGTSQNYSAGGSPWNGYIDDFRITNGVARYTSNFTVPSSAFPNQ
jgi:hypothetical protein